MRKLFISMMLAGAAFVAQPAQAALPLCGAGDISPTSPTFTAFNAFDCSGFVSGQAFADSAASKTILQGLLDDLFGVGAKDAATISYTKLSGLNGAPSVDFTASPFNTSLNGMTLLGFHFGAGKGSPGDGSGLKGQAATSSVLYYFDAGTDLNTVFLKYKASSDVVLFSTNPPAIPEPATWAMMIAGFGAVGYAMRRRRKVTVSFA